MASESTASILTLVNTTLELPTLPEVLVKLNEVMADPEVAVEEIARVISADPAVSTNILRLVNSAYYGLQVRVSTVSLAVSIMGFAMIRRVALKAAIFSTFAGDGQDRGRFDPAGFWKHSIFTGVAARVLGGYSDRFRETHAEDLYTCGLLHDIGKLILADNASAAYDEALDRAAATGSSVREVEREVFDFDHADVGSVLAIKWFLPEELAIAIRYHHAPMQDPFHKELSALIHLADHLACSAGLFSTVGATPASLDLDIYDAVGLEPQDVEALLRQVHEDFEATSLPW